MVLMTVSKNVVLQLVEVVVEVVVVLVVVGAGSAALLQLGAASVFQ